MTKGNHLTLSEATLYQGNHFDLFYFGEINHIS